MKPDYVAVSLLFLAGLSLLVLLPGFWIGTWVYDAIGAARRASRRPAVRPAIAPLPGRPQPAEQAVAPLPPASGIFRFSETEAALPCAGPDAAGRCSCALPDGTVPCGGRLLALPVPIRNSRVWHIPEGSRTCVLGSYDVYRTRAGGA